MTLKTSAMIASIAAEGQRTTPAPFGHTLARIARDRPQIVGMTADLGKYTDLHIFAAAHPDRYYQMGMAEQLLMGAAAGMAREGFTPFVTTYAVFAARRAYDFIFMAIAEDRLPVKIICALPGLTTGYGPSHQATEDLAIFRGMPGLTIIDPCDATEIEEATEAIADHPGPVYMRLLRGNVPRVLDVYPGRFEVGRARMVIKPEVTKSTSPPSRKLRALEAAEVLAADRIDAGVLHVATIKPLDWRVISAALAQQGRLVVIAENHSVIGGLGEAILSQAALSGHAGRLRHIGLPDAFLDAGALPTLHDRYGISTEAMVERVKSWM
jgi:transketolase